MYRFYDTTEMVLPREELPSEALCLNGAFIEKMVPGYHTTYTTGREGNSREISQTESSGRDGARFRSVRREPREIRVGFQLESRDARDYADKFNALKKLVKDEEAELIFNDEPDKYFIGTLRNIEINNAGELAVTGELVFQCSDPYKYAVEETTITVNAEAGVAAFELDYKGTVEAYPTIRTTTRANTETLLFSDDGGNLISIGTPDAASSGLSRGSKIFAAKAPKMLAEATYPEGIHRYAGESEIMTPVRTPDGSQELVTINGTQYLTIQKVNPTAADTETAEDDETEEWFGDVSIDVNSVSGISCHMPISTTTGTNYSCQVQPIFYADDLRETGYLHFGLAFTLGGSGSGTIQLEEAEIIIEKTGIGSTYATAHLCVYGSVSKSVRIRIDKDNPITGLNGYGIGISRFGTVYTFTLGEEQYQVDAASYYSMFAGQIPTYAIFSMARVKGQEQMTMGFAAAQVIATTRDSEDDLVEIMRGNDIVSVDCDTGDIRVNGRPVPSLGSIDNDWTAFSLKPGYNRVECSATTSELLGAKPTSYTMTYREAWE